MKILEIQEINTGGRCFGCKSNASYRITLDMGGAIVKICVCDSCNTFFGIGHIIEHELLFYRPTQVLKIESETIKRAKERGTNVCRITKLVEGVVGP